MVVQTTNINATACQTRLRLPICLGRRLLIRLVLQEVSRRQRESGIRFGIFGSLAVIVSYHRMQVLLIRANRTEATVHPS